MKRLILLLLAAACGHEHPHDHSHDLEHEHYSAFNLGLPYAYIMRVDPPPPCTFPGWTLLRSVPRGCRAAPFYSKIHLEWRTGSRILRTWCQSIRR